ncbi:MAG: phage late control D family protein [Methylobacter sp.]
MDSAARNPRGIIKVDGEVIHGWESFETDNNTFYQADTFRVTFALSDMPPDRGADWWAARREVAVEIFAGFPVDPENFTESELNSLIYGRADDITVDLTSMRVEVSGRDMTSLFIDAKTTEKFQNLTSSQIVSQLATRRGLTPVVTATKTKAGKYYEIDHARLTDERSEWDLLTWLAHEENFVVYVQGQNLHFEPKPDPSTPPYVLEWDWPTDERGYPVFSGKTISFSRNLTLAKDVIVTVRSWNGKSGKAFSKTARATHNKNTVLAGAAQPLGDAQTYSYTIPGLTPEQALQRAQALLREITQHEVRLSATLPADNILGVTSVIKVVGTNTAFDQIYYPDNIVRTMSITDGYSMSITAKNHSAESEVSI